MNTVSFGKFLQVKSSFVIFMLIVKKLFADELSSRDSLTSIFLYSLTLYINAIFLYFLILAKV